MDWNASTGLPRRVLLRVFAATALTAAPTFANAFSLLRGAGEFRRLRVYSGRTGEVLNAVYWADGEYIADVLNEINHFFRDWHNNEVHRIDARTLDIMAAAHKLLDTEEPFQLLSGYRSPQINGTQNFNRRGGASNPRHTIGQAADVRMRSRNVAQVALAAGACHMGGVGRYSKSNFTHIDCGPIRVWDA
ncbi:DUF882 domain-containing protein [Pararhodobacter sp. SW119]|uniref:YcbK family protein n=1 Tax=Pararhodobacter sp. SW119 TaxID=2780075 RepID=UPI001AE03F08|nr:DUF882 domain-containing protein [Pararhodobacter sp. SW119]